MDKIIFFILFIISCNLYSQTYQDQFDSGYYYSKWDWVNLKSRRDARQHGIMAALMFTSGAARGIEQKLNYSYHDFELRHPNANPQFWNPKYSWTNKYKHHDPNLGPKFLFSTNALVWLTDGKHLMDAFNNTPIYICVTLPIAYPTYKQHNWHDIIGRGLMLAIWRSAGFYMTYNIIY